MSAININITNMDNNNQYVSATVNFDDSTWTIFSNPRGIPVLDTQGKVFAVVIGGQQATNLYRNDGSTVVSSLLLFGAASAVGDAGSGTLSLDPDTGDPAWNAQWKVNSVV